MDTSFLGGSEKLSPADFRVVAFDLDGTLIDNIPLLLQAWKTALLRLNVERSDEEILRLFGKSTTLIAEELLKGEEGVSAEEVRNLKDEIYEELWVEHAKLMPSAREILEYLKSKRLTLAVASSNKAERIWRILKHFQIDGFFKTVVGYDEVKHGKPHPDMILKLAEKLGCKTSEIVYVGDSGYDVEAGRAAGTLTILIPSEWLEYDKSGENFYHNLKSLKELEQLFP